MDAQSLNWPVTFDWDTELTYNLQLVDTEFNCPNQLDLIKIWYPIKFANSNESDSIDSSQTNNNKQKQLQSIFNN